MEDLDDLGKDRVHYSKKMVFAINEKEPATSST